MVAGAGVERHAQLPHAGKRADGLVEEAAVGEQGEEGVDDGAERAAMRPQRERRAMEKVDERGGEVGPVTSAEQAVEEASGVREEAGAGGEMGGEADVGGGGEGVGEEVVGVDGVEGAEGPQAVGNGSGGGAGGGGGGCRGGGEGGGVSAEGKVKEDRVPARPESAEEVAARGEE